MADWRDAVKNYILQRLDEIEGRLHRLNQRKSELLAEKKRIMNAAIHVNRRKEGKT